LVREKHNKIKKSDKPRLPTVDEFLTFKPKRNDYEWYENSEGFIEIKVPKFQSNIGKSFCKLIKKDEHFIAKMDKIGTIVWKNADGIKTVSEILEMLKKEFPDEKDIDQRLFLFLQQIKSLNYIYY